MEQMWKWGENMIKNTGDHSCWLQHTSGNGCWMMDILLSIYRNFYFAFYPVESVYITVEWTLPGLSTGKYLALLWKR